jgi:hypothetical protein
VFLVLLFVVNFFVAFFAKVVKYFLSALLRIWSTLVSTFCVKSTLVSLAALLHVCFLIFWRNFRLPVLFKATERDRQTGKLVQNKQANRQTCVTTAKAFITTSSKPKA